MIEFLGTPLLKSDAKNPKHLSIAQVCGLSDERVSELVNAFGIARKTAFEKGAIDTKTGLGMGGFSPALLLTNAEEDLTTLGEVFMAGIIAGQICNDVTVKADEQNRRMVKMLHLMATDPAKAMRKMQKDLAKVNGSAVEGDQKTSQQAGEDNQ